jgi:hypothetical protein
LKGHAFRLQPPHLVKERLATCSPNRSEGQVNPGRPWSPAQGIAVTPLRADATALARRNAGALRQGRHAGSGAANPRRDRNVAPPDSAPRSRWHACQCRISGTGSRTATGGSPCRLSRSLNRFAD